MKSIIQIIVGLALLAGLIYGLFLFQDTWLPYFLPGEKKEADVITVSQVSRGTIQNYVSCGGEITPVSEVEIKSEVGARVKNIHVSAGDRVKSDQLLVELDDSELLSEKLSIETEIEGRNLELEKAGRDYERNRKLFEKDLVSEKIYLDSQTEQKMALNQIEQSKRRLQTNSERLRKTKIRSPIAGTVLKVNVIPGQVVVGAQSVNTGTLLMNVANLQRMCIRSHVNQVEVQELKLGMKGEVSVESLKGIEIEGEIVDISPVATVVRNVKGFEVVILLEHPPEGLKPGMTAEASFLTAEAKDVIVTPISSVFREGEDGSYVYVQTSLEPQKFEKREVKVGLSDFNQVEVLDGLGEDEEVALRKPQMAP